MAFYLLGEDMGGIDIDEKYICGAEPVMQFTACITGFCRAGEASLQHLTVNSRMQFILEQ